LTLLTLPAVPDVDRHWSTIANY